jgi:hypothetical protein
MAVAMGVMISDHSTLGRGSRSSRPATPLSAVVFVLTGVGEVTLFDLDGCVLNIELMVQVFGRLMEKCIAPIFISDQMGCQDV